MQSAIDVGPKFFNEVLLVCHRDEQYGKLQLTKAFLVLQLADIKNSYACIHNFRSFKLVFDFKRKA